MPAFCISCSEMAKRWQELVSPRGSAEADVWIGLEKLTACVISRTAFGNSYKEGKRIFKLQEQQTKLVLKAHQLPHVPGFR